MRSVPTLQQTAFNDTLYFRKSEVLSLIAAAGGGGDPQTPWASNIDSAGFTLSSSSGPLVLNGVNTSGTQVELHNAGSVVLRLETSVIRSFLDFIPQGALDLGFNGSTNHWGELYIQGRIQNSSGNNSGNIDFRAGSPGTRGLVRFEDSENTGTYATLQVTNSEVTLSTLAKTLSLFTANNSTPARLGSNSTNHVAYIQAFAAFHPSVDNAIDLGRTGVLSWRDLNLTRNILNPTTAGLGILAATTHKLGFHGATPIVQGASVADASGGATVDAEARTAINALISRIEATGLIATV